MICKSAPKNRWTLPLLLIAASTASFAQKTVNTPATDSSANASPIKAAPKAPVDDAAQQASPVSPMPSGGRSLAASTALPIKLNTAIDSGSLKNGQSVAAVLTQPVRSNGITFAAGTPAELSVIGTVPAGKLSAAGEFSLQLTRVGKTDVFTDVQTFRGKPGHKDLPDSNPEVGTDAGLPQGAPLTFHVQPPPSPADGAPGAASATTGSVTGVASGAAPPPGSDASADAVKQITSGVNTGKNATQTVAPANNTFAPAQQTSAPASTQPH